MTYREIPTTVSNPDAYEAAIQRNIRINAIKGARARWFASVEDAQELHNWLYGIGEFNNYWVTKNGRKLEDQEFHSDGYPLDDEASHVVNPLVDGIFDGKFGGFLYGLREAMENYGALTEKQAATVRNALTRKREWVEQAAVRKRKYAEEARKSEWIGQIKERRVWDLVIDKVISFEGQWGYSYINLMHDADGNRIVGKGSKSYGTKGATIKVKATITDHEDRDGIKQTVINRPAFC